MKQCIYCGKEYPDEASVCAIDGEPLRDVMPPPPVTVVPSKDSKRPRNVGAILGGSLTAGYGLYAICTGHISGGSGRMSPVHEYFVTQDPHMFWSMVCVVFACSAFFLIWGFIGKR